MRGQVVLEGDPARRAHGLPRLLLQRDGVLHVRRAAARRARPRARAVPARDPLRAEPHPLPPGVARHDRARPRRDLDLLVLLQRARQGPRPVRVLVRPADAHPLHPGRRGDRGHPGGLGREGAAVHRGHGGARRPVRGDPRPQRDLPAAHQGRRHRPAGAAARPRRDRAAAARRRQPVGPAQGVSLLLVRQVRLQDPGRHGGRLLRPLPRARRRDPRVVQRSSGRRSRACRRARTSRATGRSRCRRGTSWRPRWRR